MFTGIIEALGTIQSVSVDRTNKTFWINSNISSQLKIDESLCHNGVCLTVEDINDNKYQVTAIQETLEKTNLQNWKQGDVINLERAMQMNGRIDGHIVQGHVDGTAKCILKKDLDGSFEFIFSFDENKAALIIEKGSICVNGVSLTAFNVARNTFAVAIIPYTFEHTNFKNIKEGDTVNLEFDMLGKYVARIQSLQ
ncbi:riboflavin synthase [Ginsengibacter hankyongi]|uniref:Riboflavin synthase n=1 Tax=Ginsengibacter hankyongi TaxID=2607284 RepID=A0A5J5IKF4_9BACT|nr:riboflavin synthase [Ginsengibacter hankyongi]KAA9041500.1 riboflavin synthase [Ginsengibacter hankyongi]